MKKLLMIPILLIGVATPIKAEALTWKEFWEPFVESYHYGHDHGSGHWEDWRYDHYHGGHHHHHRPRRRRVCEKLITEKEWVRGGNPHGRGYWHEHTRLHTYYC